MYEKKFDELLESVNSIARWIRFGGMILVGAIVVGVLNFIAAVMNY